MDQKTQEARRRMKAARTPRGVLSPFEPRGPGRKGKPHQTFPTKICVHIDGGENVYFKRLRKNRKPGESEYINGLIVKGGRKCPKPATTTRNRNNLPVGYCDDHNPESPNGRDGE